jgi:hypothetical protein
MVKESSRNVTNTPSHTATEDVNTHEPSREEIRGEMIDYCYRSEVQNKKNNERDDTDSSNDSKVIKSACKNYNNYIASIIDSRPDSIIHPQFSAEDELTAEDRHRLLLDARKYSK